MKKLAILIVLMMGLGLSAVSLEDAIKKAQQYQETGETINIDPQDLTIAGANSYWVIEMLGTFSKINAMIPINAKTGAVEVADSMKDVLKTHYLANYFATDETIADFLESTRSYAVNKKEDFRYALEDGLQVYEAQLPAGITLANLGPLEEAITASNTKNDALRTQIISTQALIEATAWKTTDVSSVQTSLSSVFTKQKAFFDSLDNVATYASDLYSEIAGNDNLKVNYSAAVSGFQATINSYRLKEGAPTELRDTMDANKKTIDAFFNSLDVKANEYLAKLRDRFNNKLSASDIQAIADKITAYNENLTYINNNANTIPPAYLGDIDDLSEAIVKARDYYNAKNYTAAQGQFSGIDDAIASLMDKIGTCPASCSGGKILSGCQCACPSDKKEENGQCVSEGFSLNLPLIGGLALIIIVLIVFKYKDKIFQGGGQVEEKPKDAWSNYKF